MNNEAAAGAATALLLLPHVTAPAVNETLLRIAQEANWPTDPDMVVPVNLPTGSREAVRLAKGTVVQAASVAYATKDVELLGQMAARERRRAVRRRLAANPHLPATAVPPLWDRERADAARTGADGVVQGQLLARMAPADAVAAFAEAIPMNATGPLDVHKGALAEGVVRALVAAGDVDRAVSVFADMTSSTTRQGRAAAEGVAYWATYAALTGRLPVTTGDWADLLEQAPASMRAAAGRAAFAVWKAEPGDVTLDDVWVRVASQSDGGRYTSAETWSGGQMAVWQDLDGLYAALGTDRLVELIATGTLPVVLAFGDDVRMNRERFTALDPAGVAALLVRLDEADRSAGCWWFDQLANALATEAQVRAAVAAVDAGDCRPSHNPWFRALSTVPMAEDLVVRLLTPQNLPGWAHGVNAPADAETWDRVTARIAGTAGFATAVDAVFRLTDGNLPDELAVHVWATTPGLAQFVSGHGSDTLRRVTAQQLTARLGDDPDTWHTALRLMPDWEGTLGDLCAVSTVL